MVRYFRFASDIEIIGFVAQQIRDGACRFVESTVKSDDNGLSFMPTLWIFNDSNELIYQVQHFAMRVPLYMKRTTAREHAEFIRAKAIDAAKD